MFACACHKRQSHSVRAGKTTVLRHLLENTAELRIGCIVNDVATINVDAKLLRNDRNRGRRQQLNSTTDLTDTIELANGCACERIQMLLHGYLTCLNPFVHACVMHLQGKAAENSINAA